MRFVFPFVALALGIGMAPASATVTTLTFDGDICGADGAQACGNGSEIGATHGSTAEVSVSYSQTSSTSVTSPFVNFWSTGYGDVSNVIYAGGGNVLGISFTPVSGFELRLIGFTAGCFQGRADCLSLPYSVSSASFSTISGTATPTGVTADVIAINSPWAAQAISFAIGPNMFNGAVDNVIFESRALQTGGVVPEPASWAMLIAGFGLVGAVARRRRRGLICG